MTRVLDCTGDDTARRPAVVDAARAVSSGELVVIPTDTVYGVAADAFDPAAVRRLLAAKGRGRETPVPVLVGAWRAVNGLVDELPDVARSLISAFWPGPLTLVVAEGSGLSWDLGDTNGTVAVRMPLHPVALELLAETGPLAVSSANKTGAPAPTTAADAQAQLGDEVSVYLDAGGTGYGTASTIVDCTTDPPRLLREGGVTRRQLESIVGGPLG